MLKFKGLSRWSLAALFALGCSAWPAEAAGQPDRVSPTAPETQTQVLERQLRAQGSPMAIVVAGGGRDDAAAAGVGSDGRPFTVDTPLRVASVTKTFVAATALRLWEQGRLDLDAPIGPLLTPRLDALLRADGFDTRVITIRHLLSHSAGLPGYFGDDRFRAAVLADPRRVWSAEDEVRLTMDYGAPLSSPGAEFHYSDTGYILVGDIIERITGLGLAAAVRRELRLDRLALRATWWERMEPAPPSVAPRARQFLGEVEITNIDPSIDLYGGGGLIMSTRDMATFFSALFGGHVFDRAETLSEMLRQGPHRGADRYRLGIFVRQLNGQEIYFHGGFWGTIVYYSPSTRTTVAAATTQQTAYASLRAIAETVVAPQAQTRPDQIRAPGQ